MSSVALFIIGMLSGLVLGEMVLYVSDRFCK